MRMNMNIYTKRNHLYECYSLLFNAKLNLFIFPRILVNTVCESHRSVIKDILCSFKTKQWKNESSLAFDKFSIAFSPFENNVYHSTDSTIKISMYNVHICIWVNGGPTKILDSQLLKAKITVLLVIFWWRIVVSCIQHFSIFIFTCRS